jgi:hypothetical protein
MTTNSNNERKSAVVVTEVIVVVISRKTTMTGQGQKLTERVRVRVREPNSERQTSRTRRAGHLLLQGAKRPRMGGLELKMWN